MTWILPLPARTRPRAGVARWRPVACALGIALAPAAPVQPAAAPGCAGPGAGAWADNYTPPDDPAELMRLDEPMRAYFAARVNRQRSADVRLEQITDAILGEDGLHFRYRRDGNFDVRTAFRRREGNCMAFAMLVVAVAREYGLPAEFTAVATNPQWTALGTLVLETRHINVTVDLGPLQYEIDLLATAETRSRRAEARPMKDRRALAEFYSNAGVFALVQGARAEAIRRLEQATAIDPSCSAAWVNLGNAHLLAPDLAAAARSFEQALRVNREELAATSALAHIYRAQGRADEAAAMDRRAERYRLRNPYFQYAEARADLAAGRLDEAHEHAARALNLKRDERDFYTLMIAIEQARGRDSAAARWAGRMKSAALAE